ETRGPDRRPVLYVHRRVGGDLAVDEADVEAALLLVGQLRHGSRLGARIDVDVAGGVNLRAAGDHDAGAGDRTGDGDVDVDQVGAQVRHRPDPNVGLAFP